MDVSLLLEAAEFLDRGAEARGEESPENGNDRRGSISRSESGSGYNFALTSRDQSSPSPSSLSPVSRSDLNDERIPINGRDRRRVLGAGTREVHNKMEKNRRAQLKECFDRLGGLLPASEGKPSNLNILQNARKEVFRLKTEEKRLIKEKEKLKEARVKLAKRYRETRKKSNRVHCVSSLVQTASTVEEDYYSDSTTTASECGDMCSDTDDASEGTPPDSPVSVTHAQKFRSNLSGKGNFEMDSHLDKSSSSGTLIGRVKRFYERKRVQAQLAETNDADRENYNKTNGEKMKLTKSLLKHTYGDAVSVENSKKYKNKGEESVFCNIRTKTDFKPELESNTHNNVLPVLSDNIQKHVINITSKPEDGCSTLANSCVNSPVNKNTTWVTKPSVPSCSLTNSAAISIHPTYINNNEAMITIPATATPSSPKPCINVQKPQNFIIPSADSIPQTIVSDVSCFSAGKATEDQKQVLMTKMLLQSSPTINTVQNKNSVISKSPVGQITVGNIPSHITVLRTATNTLTLPAQMLPNGAIQLNNNPTANVIGTPQPTLQLLAQPQNTPIKLLQSPTTNVGAVLTPAIAIVKRSQEKGTVPITSSSMLNIAANQITTVGGKLVSKSANGVSSLISSNQAVASKLPIIQNNVITNGCPKASAPATKVPCNLSHATEPPYTFSKFTFKQSNSAAPVNKIASNLSNPPQVSVMTMTTQPSGKAFTQILHQTLVQGIPSTVSNIIQAGNPSISRRVNNINHHGLPVSSPVGSAPSTVLSPVTQLIPQTIISPIAPQATATILPQGTVITSSGITEVTRALPQATPIMSSYPQHVTAPMSQIVTAPISVVSGSVNTTNTSRVLTSQTSDGSLVTNTLPFQAVNHIPFVHQQCSNSTPLKSLVMVSNVIPPTLELTTDSKLLSPSERKT